MADAYLIKITAQAQNQMREIAHYIASELQSPDTALRLLDTLENGISSLSVFPHRAALTEEEPWHTYGIRKLQVKNFFVYFWIDQDANEVQITAVVYDRRDQVRQLSQMHLDL